MKYNFKKLFIKNTKIGQNSQTFFISEIGSNLMVILIEQKN